MATLSTPLPAPLEDALKDFEFPQREAAFFYGLFLRGHPAERLREDIKIPVETIAKWDRETASSPQLRPVLERVIRYREHVLAIFESLIGRDSSSAKVQ